MRSGGHSGHHQGKRYPKLEQHQSGGHNQGNWECSSINVPPIDEACLLSSGIKDGPC